MGYITYNTDAFKNNENVMIEVNGESFILSYRMGNAIHNLIIGISNTQFHLKITTDKESYNYDENLDGIVINKIKSSLSKFDKNIKTFVNIGV